MHCVNLQRLASASAIHPNGDSGQTVRSRLHSHDGHCRSPSVFRGPVARLSDQAQRAVYAQYCRGESIASLAAKFNCPKAHVGRLIGAVRARRIMALPLEFVPSREFSAVGGDTQEQHILGPLPPDESVLGTPRLPRDLPTYLTGLYEVRLLSRAQETYLFRKMNYLKYRASKLRAQLDPARPKKALMDQVERLYDEAVAVKNSLVSANLRLVVSVAKHYVGPGSAFFELLSDGNTALARAVEEFDYTWKIKFRTYATRAIRASVARTIPAQRRCRDRLGGAGSAKPAENLEPREQQTFSKWLGLAHGRQPRTINGNREGVRRPVAAETEARGPAPSPRGNWGDSLQVRYFLFDAMLRGHSAGGQ